MLATISILMIADLFYLVFNLIKALPSFSNLSFEEKLVVCLTIDISATGVAMTLSTKQALAARTYVALCTMSEGVAIGLMGIIMGLAGGQGTATTCCARQIWWAAHSSCSRPGAVFWLSIALRAVMWRNRCRITSRLSTRLDALEKASRRARPTDTPFHAIRATLLIQHYPDIPFAVVNFVSLRYLVHRTTQSDVGRWSDWGQSATLITCTFGVIHCMYSCMPSFKTLKERSEQPVSASRSRIDGTIGMLSRVALYVVRLASKWYVRILTPRAKYEPAKSKAELGKELRASAKIGDLFGVQEGLEAGAPVDAQEDGETPLTLATRFGHVDTIKTLLQHGASQWPKTNWAGFMQLESPLQIAIRAGNLELVRLFTEDQDIMLLTRPYPSTPLGNAGRADQRAIVGYLFEMIVDNIQVYGYANFAIELLTVMSQPAHAGNTELIRILVNMLNEVKGKLLPDSNVPDSDRLAHIAILEAVQGGNVEIVQLMLENGIVPIPEHFQRRSPIHEAATAFSVNAVAITQALAEHYQKLEVTIDVRDQRSRTALHNAVVAEQVFQVELLLRHGADANVDDGIESPLQSAITIIDQLFEHQPESEGRLKPRDVEGYADRMKRVNYKMLTDPGMIPSVMSSYRADTPGQVEWARNFQHLISLKLLEAGADPNLWPGELLEDDTEPPLILAALRQRLGLVKTLLQRGAKPDLGARRRTPFTALHVAAILGHYEMAAALLLAGASVDIGNELSFTPFELAYALKHDETVRLMRMAVAVKQAGPHPTGVMLHKDSMSIRAAGREVDGCVNWSLSTTLTGLE